MATIFGLLLFGGIFIFLLLLFHFINHRRKNIHFQKIQTLENSIILHHNQVSFRQSTLDKYNFLVHNLNEVLIPQPEIGSEKLQS